MTDQDLLARWVSDWDDMTDEDRQSLVLSRIHPDCHDAWEDVINAEHTLGRLVAGAADVYWESESNPRYVYEEDAYDYAVQINEQQRDEALAQTRLI